MPCAFCNSILPACCSFRQYGQLVERQLMQRYNAVEHWAKIELPSDPAALAELQRRIQRRYPVQVRLLPARSLELAACDALLG